MTRNNTPLPLFARITPASAHEDGRKARVCFALALIWSLSMLDLGLTTAMTVTLGMFESNPMARGIVRSTGSAYSLAGWKIISTSLCTVILLLLRGNWKAEVGAWIGVGALRTTITWVLYLGHVRPALDATTTMTERSMGENWMGTGRSPTPAPGGDRPIERHQTTGANGRGEEPAPIHVKSESGTRYLVVQ